ncbi:hypothetical protein CU098_004128 [Rhizopus stolonifer]|uniref:RRM domain-containing protein n=1 Tax=Rhizopus stolonifer TaxID=4846 RepID=A0A367IRK2_RHIST|nr:hypothetical protein CU098_004128 [Rhizopus stolonifer]
MLTSPYVHMNPKKQHGDDVVAMIDYTNLYIKNLDPEVTSYDLFKKFRVYGKIISARVMKDTLTGVSKGYGFVSYTTMEEANEALQQMNGALVNSKNIVVSFHTHKKPASTVKVKNSHNSNNNVVIDYMNLSPPTTASSSNHQVYPIYPTSQPSPPYSHQQQQHQQHQQQQQQNAAMMPQEPYIPLKSNIPPSATHNPWNETGIWIHTNTHQKATTPPSVHYHPSHLPSMHVPTQQTQTTTTTNASVLVSPSTGCSSPPPLIDLSQPYYPHLDTTPSQIQLQRIRDAISAQLKDYQQKDLNDLVDLIQSLKKRDLSLCLFNPTFLKQKIDEAYEALYLFQNPPITQKPSLMDESNSKLNLTAEQIHSASVILSSLEGMTLNKKKRVFGDIFFPYVRATGVKHAPKVTIRLLDTVPLEELAYNMYDKQELTRKAQYIHNELYNNKN